MLFISRFFPVMLAAFVASGAALGDASPVITTTQGAVQGTVQNGVPAYLGVPYAKPPIGPLRWRAPQAATGWDGVRDATHFAASCYQSKPGLFGPYTAEFIDTPESSEDCLYLNIWTPARHVENLPVFVWIHGGGFSGGSGAVEIYNGSRLASKGAVVITLNYRLGPFGFLALPGLSAKGQGEGTYGLQDIIAALHWIKDNASRFGGDPGRVTIAGQSAGAISVDDLLLSPPARGLFARAVAESGSGMGVGAPTLAEAEQTGTRFTALLGTTDIAQLRTISADKILAAVPSFLPTAGGGKATSPPLSFRPAIDNVVLVDNPDRADAPSVAPVPLLTGFNADEAWQPGKSIAPAEFEASVRDRYGNAADRFLALYSHATPEQAAASAELIARDRSMASLLLFSQQRSRTAAQPIFAYMFDHALPVTQPPGWGAFHTAEVPYLFGTLDRHRRPYTDTDTKISDVIASYWLNFARTGDPNGGGLPQWPAVRQDGDTLMELGDKMAPSDAVSSPARLAAFRDYVAHGGTLSLF